MGARFDRLVIAVDDLDDAVARWGAAGLPAERGGAHPVGTENALVRGPAPGLRGSTSLPACPSDPDGSRLSTIFAQISYEMLRKPVLIAR